MNKDYISGFFDADGYISVSVSNKGANPTILVGFTNNYLPVLQNIQKTILQDLNLKGCITTKTSKNIKHAEKSYDLKYKGFNAVEKLFGYLDLNHPKKQARFLLASTIKHATVRNGKYTTAQKENRKKLVEGFLSIK